MNRGKEVHAYEKYLNSPGDGLLTSISAYPYLVTAHTIYVAELVILLTQPIFYAFFQNFSFIFIVLSLGGLEGIFPDSRGGKRHEGSRD